jgi:hypothetical protein
MAARSTDDAAVYAPNGLGTGLTWLAPLSLFLSLSFPISLCPSLSLSLSFYLSFFLSFSLSLSLSRSLSRSLVVVRKHLTCGLLTLSYNFKYYIYLYNGTITYKPRRQQRRKRAQAHNSTPYRRQQSFM